MRYFMSMRIIKRKYELKEFEWKIKMINNSRDKKESIWRGLLEDSFMDPIDEKLWINSK